MEFEFNDQPLDSLDGVPEDFRGLYAQDSATKKFRLDSADPKVKSSVGAIMRMQGALKKERTERAADKAKMVDLTLLAPYGKTVEEIAAGIEAKISEARGTNAETIEKQVSKIKEDLAKGYADKEKKTAKKVEALQNQLFTLLGTSAAKAELKAQGAIDPDLAMPFVLNQLKAVEENGAYDVRVVDEAGDPRYSTVTGSFMVVKELVSEMKTREKFKPLFKSETSTGSGTPPGGPARRTTTGEPAERSPIDKIAAGLKSRR